MTHHHDTWEYVLEVKDDPCHSPRVASSAIMNENKAEIKDSVTSCDWQSRYPDPRGKTVSYEEWNCLVDLYYDQRGWDRKTGWPTRKTWEACGLRDVTDELGSIGKLPVSY